MYWEKIINKEWKYDEQAAIIRGDKERMESIKQSMAAADLLITELKEKSKETQSQILDKLSQSLYTNLVNIKTELSKTEQAQKEKQATHSLTSMGHIPFREGSGPPKMPGERGYSASRTQRAIQNDPRAR
tara:strand:- start:5683 stop:6072 length:390 start_codon:yes stop_codon:yes gene_type:complete